MVDVRTVAKYIIEKGKDFKYPVSNMKLQKLLYYCQGWYLAYYGKPLFQEDFYKWLFGPVCLDIYYTYKVFGGARIIDTYTPGSLSNEITDYIDKILKTYGKFSAFQLSDLSHTEKPWIVTEDAEIIKKSLMKDYYTDKLKRAND